MLNGLSLRNYKTVFLLSIVLTVVTVWQSHVGVIDGRLSSVVINMILWCCWLAQIYRVYKKAADPFYKISATTVVVFSVFYPWVCMFLATGCAQLMCEWMHVDLDLGIYVRAAFYIAMQFWWYDIVLQSLSVERHSQLRFFAAAIAFCQSVLFQFAGLLVFAEQTELPIFVPAWLGTFALLYWAEKVAFQPDVSAAKQMRFNKERS